MVQEKYDVLDHDAMRCQLPNSPADKKQGDCGLEIDTNKMAARRKSFIRLRRFVSVKIWSKTNKKTKARSQGLIARPNVLGETKVLRSTRPTYQLGPTNSAQYQDQLGPLSDQVGPTPSNTEDLAWDPSPHLTSIKCFLCFKFIDIFLCKIFRQLAALLN